MTHHTATASAPNDCPLTCARAPTLVLVDGSSYLYRAFYALPDLRAVPSDTSSAPTGAIRGMVNMLLALQKEVPADYAVCVFDAPGPTFRDALYPAYKAQRSPMPDDLRAQIAPIHDVVRLLGWHILSVAGVEADDVIGTLAHAAAGQGVQVVISSGDKDLAQLVTERITIIDTMSGKRRDVAGVMAEFGVPPQRMLDFQTLVGDSVDNVPGVTKVGPKTAAKWLHEYETLDQLMLHADDISGVAGHNLRAALTWLPQARQILSIKTDCDLSAHIPDFPAMQSLTTQAVQLRELADFYQQYGFKGALRALTPTTASTASPAPSVSPDSGDLFADHNASALAQSIQHHNVVYDTVLTWADFEHWLARIEQADLVSLDTETTALDAMTAQLVGISVSVRPGEAAYIALAHNGPDAPQQLPLAQVLARLRPWLEDASRPKLGQHIKYDSHVFANHGITVRGYQHDTMLQSYVLEAHRPHNLSSLALRHAGRSSISYEDLCGKGARQIGFSQVALDQAAAYACEDADLTLQVHQVLWPRIQACDKLRAVYALEIASSAALWRMERNGVLIDAAQLAQQSAHLGQRIMALQEQAYAQAGQPFNLSSPKQLGEIFFDQLGMPVVKKTSTGARSTDEEVLEKLAQTYELPATLLEHRGLSKLKSTYTDKLGLLAHARTGRVHTHYAQAVVVTGRLSSNEPNLQNIPVRTEQGRRIRQAFIAPAGRLIASCDYSQIELRIMAHLSDDAALMHAFHTGLDVHSATAAEVFDVPLEQVSQEQRRCAKVINFGLIYGMGRFGLAKNLGLDARAAQNYIDRYFERYPGVRRYMQQTKERAKAVGYVETVLGRRLHLPDINAASGPRRTAAERAAINAPMQGTAADLIKLAMVAVQEHLDAHKPDIVLVMQVHDELVFELPERQADWLRAEVPRIMAGVASLKVPLLAQVGIGPNWEAAH